MLIDLCPCGQTHDADPEKWAAFQRVTAGLPWTVPVSVAGYGTWQVPRIYPYFHTLVGLEVPELAHRYGWEQA